MECTDMVMYTFDEQLRFALPLASLSFLAVKL